MGWRSSSWRSRSDVQVGRCAGAGVEVLVGAADGEVDAVRVEVERHGAGGVGEVPEHERTVVVGDGSDLRDVGDGSRSVVDNRQRHQRAAAVDRRRPRCRARRRRRVGRDQPQLEIRWRRPALRARSGRSGNCRRRSRSRAGRDGRRARRPPACRGSPTSNRSRPPVRARPPGGHGRCDRRPRRAGRSSGPSRARGRHPTRRRRPPRGVACVASGSRPRELPSR